MTKYSVFEIANWFINKKPLSLRKLQTLVYYSEAWSKALYDKSLIKDTSFEAWSYGPVSTKLYQKYKNYECEDINLKEPSNITDPKVLYLLESVWMTYADLSVNELEAITRKEYPWKQARTGYSEGEHCTKQISKQSMKLYYRAIYFSN